MTLEEAFEKLCKAQDEEPSCGVDHETEGYEFHDEGAPYCPECDALEPPVLAAAKAAMLAAVDAVSETAGKGYEHGMGRWECDFDAIKERIEAL